MGASSVYEVIELATRGVEDTQALAGSIARVCRPGDLVVLAGEMGAGKTAFAQGFAAGLGVEEPVTSPTFTLVHSYDSGVMPVHHADLYRLDRFGELDDLAFDELLHDGVLLVEWGDMVADVLGPHLEIYLAADDLDRPEDRVVCLRSEGRGWQSRWDRLESAVEQWRGAA